MRYLRARPPLRDALIAVVAITGLLLALQALRLARHAIGASPQVSRAFSIGFFVLVALITLAVGYRAARRGGRLRPALAAGALAVAAPSAGLAVATNWRPLTTLDGDKLAGYIIAVILIAVAGALAGAIVAALGGLVGWLRYRRAHPEEVAARAAQRAAQRAATRRRRRSERLGVFGWLMIAAILLVTMAPMGLSYLALNYLGQWEGLAASLGALLVGYGLLKLADRARWQGYLYDLIGLSLIVSGLIVGIGEITGYAIELLAGLGTMAYIWRAMDRSLGVRKPSAAEPPELAPVFFRDDGESLAFYPSRRKLVGHALFAGGVALVFGALVYVFRGADPTIVFALAIFPVMGFLFGLIPDLTRLLHRWPTLTVTSDGITDRGSGLITGFGLIPWHEIEGVVGGIRPPRSPFTDLLIIPVNFERLVARQPRLKRPLLRLGSAMRGGLIAISSLYLAPSTNEVATRISDYVRSHAPASYLEQDEEDNETQPPADAAE